MTQYVIAFDMDTTSMTDAGMTESEQIRIYQTEIPRALKAAGFNEEPLQGSVYMTQVLEDSLPEMQARLATVIVKGAHNFFVYCKHIHLFRVEEWCDFADVLTRVLAAVQERKLP